MKTKKNIEKTSYLYRFGHSLFHSAFRLFYKKVVVIGKENLPRGEAFFVAPNHQNAMMDAMAVLFTIGTPNPVFMARADMFKKKLIANLLYFVKILPVFRIRDGKDSLKNNDQIFQQTVGIIGKGVPLVIFPEGNHDGHRRFRVVKKGIIRIAFTALEQFEEGKKLYVVPTGIEYNTSYQKAMQNLVVYYGKPLLVNDFYDIYKEDKARGERQLQLAIFDRMSDQMIDIKTKDYYDYYDIVRETAYRDFLTNEGHQDVHAQKLFAQQKMIKGLDKALEIDETPFAPLQEKAREYNALMKSLNLRDWLFNEESYSAGTNALRLLGALLILPMALYGWLFNGLQIMYTNHMAEKRPDPQWHASFRYIMCFTLFPATHIALSLVSMSFVENNWWSFAFLLSLIFSSHYAMRYQLWCKKTFGRMRYNKMRKTGHKDFQKAEALRNEINAFAIAQK